MRDETENGCEGDYRKGKFGDFLGFGVLRVCQFQSVIDDFRDEIYLSFSCVRNCLLCSGNQLFAQLNQTSLQICYGGAMIRYGIKEKNQTTAV